MKKYYRWILAAILLIILVIIMILIKNGGIINFDNSVYKLITTNTNGVLDNIFKGFTFLASTIFVVICCLVILIFMKNKKLAGFVCGSVVISTIVNNVIKNIFQRERPLVKRLVEESTLSFPSGHTMAAVTLYGMLIFVIMKSNLSKRIKILLSILLCFIILGVACSRIYLGAHFASDVIGAILTATILLCIELNFSNKVLE